jgi:hypothetical protein
VHGLVEVAAWRSYATCSEEELLGHKICTIPAMCQYYKALVILVKTSGECLTVARYRSCAQPIVICKTLYRDSAHAVTLQNTLHVTGRGS